MKVILEQAIAAINDNDIDLLPWSEWVKLPEPENCRNIKGPENFGVYIGNR